MDSKVKALAEELVQERSLLVMGRGYNFATCLEGALVSFSLMYLMSFQFILLYIYIYIWMYINFVWVYNLCLMTCLEVNFGD